MKLKNRLLLIFSIVLSAITLLVPSLLNAHAPDQSYLYLSIYQDRITGTVEITMNDLNKALDLGIDEELYKPKTDDDKVETPFPQELMVHWPRIQQYILERVQISSPQFGNHQISFTEPTIMPLFMGVFVKSNFNLSKSNVIPEDLDISYNVLFDKDAIHRGLMVIAHNWKAGIINNEAMSSLIFTPDDTKQQLSLSDASMWKGFVALVKLGMWHIYIGLDHILFLVALMLPAVVRRRNDDELTSFQNAWKPVDRFKSAFFYILKIVTLFTIAHSITLSLAATGVINLPSRIVESIIALSIGLAAYLNMKPLFNKSESLIAFAFGLFHGLGFASVLGEKGLEGEYMVLSLLGFNVGVELGQVLIICAIFPILYFIRRSKYYPYIIYYGSILLIAIALFWFVERFFEIDLLLDNYITKAFNKVMRIIGLQ